MALWITFICFSIAAIISAYCLRKIKGWELFFGLNLLLWIWAALMIAGGIYSQR